MICQEFWSNSAFVLCDTWMCLCAKFQPGVIGLLVRLEELRLDCNDLQHLPPVCIAQISHCVVKCILLGAEKLAKQIAAWYHSFSMNLRLMSLF